MLRQQGLGAGSWPECFANFVRQVAASVFQQCGEIAYDRQQREIGPGARLEAAFEKLWQRVDPVFQIERQEEDDPHEIDGHDDEIRRAEIDFRHELAALDDGVKMKPERNPFQVSGFF